MDTKKYMMIDGLPVEIEDEKNILEVIRKAGIKLPTFCYYSELSIYGACRMCMVENKWGGLDAQRGYGDMDEHRPSPQIPQDDP